MGGSRRVLVSWSVRSGSGPTVTWTKTSSNGGSWGTWTIVGALLTGLLAFFWVNPFGWELSRLLAGSMALLWIGWLLDMPLRRERVEVEGTLEGTALPTHLPPGLDWGDEGHTLGQPFSDVEDRPQPAVSAWRVSGKGRHHVEGSLGGRVWSGWQERDQYYVAFRVLPPSVANAAADLPGCALADDGMHVVCRADGATPGELTQWLEGPGRRVAERCNELDRAAILAARPAPALPAAGPEPVVTIGDEPTVVDTTPLPPGTWEQPEMLANPDDLR